MVNALISINEQTNRTLTIVKAKYGLKNKGEAIEFVVDKFLDKEPALRPEFIKAVKKAKKQKGVKVKNFGKEFGV